LETIKELLQTLQNELENRISIAAAANNRPYRPMAIFYGGRWAHSAYPHVMHAMQFYFKNRAGIICQYLMERDAITRADAPDAPAMSDDALCEDMSRMFNSAENFANLKKLQLCTLLATQDYPDLDSFIAAFGKMAELRRKVEILCANPDCMTIVLLNEIGMNSRTAAEIRRWLTELYREENPLRVPLILLSNKLSNGLMMTSPEQVRENYELAGNLLVLANESEACNLTRFFPIGSVKPERSEILTASYQRMERPNRQICQAAVHELAGWLEKAKLQHRVLDAAQLRERLNLGSGKFSLLEDYITETMPDNLFRPEELDAMPRRAAAMGLNLSALRADEVQKHTFGALELLYTQFWNRFVESGELHRLKAGFESRLAAYFCQQLGFDSTASDISTADLFTYTRAELPGMGEVVSTYLPKRLHADIINEILSDYRSGKHDPLRAYLMSVDERMRSISAVISDFNNTYIENEISEYYEQKIDVQLGSGDGQRLLAECTSMQNGTFGVPEILAALRRCGAHLFASDSVYRLTLVDEMKVRLGYDEVSLLDYMKHTMIDTVLDRLRLHGTLNHTKIFSAILYDQSDRSFCDFIESHVGGCTFLNTGDKNVIKSVHLYAVNLI